LVSQDGLPNIRLEAAVLLVGRSSECDVVVDSKKVSRKHCCIAVVGEHLVVKDLGSTNGCRVNGQRRDECKVVEGDELTIADLHYRFIWEVAAPGKGRLTDSIIERSDRPLMLPDEEVGSPEPPAPPKAPKSDNSDSLAHIPGLS
jgi:hypothetical protein